MNEHPADIQLIMDYLDGIMPAAERTAFEKRLAGEELLRREVSNLQSMRDGVKRYGLKQQVAGIHAEMMKKPQAGRSVIRLIMDNGLRIAASLVMILGISVVYQYVTLSSSGLYQQLYEPYTVTESRGGSDSAALRNAFRQNNNQEVIRLFNSRQQPGAEDFFLAGNAYLKSDSSQAAIRTFQALLEQDRRSGSHRFEEDAEYYLALSCLSAGKIKQALPLFEKIHLNKRHAYHDKVSVWMLRRLHWLLAKK